MRAIDYYFQGDKRMVFSRKRTAASTTLAISVLLGSTAMAMAQNKPAPKSTSTSSARTVGNGEKMKIKGVVVRRDSDSFLIRDANGVDTTVKVSDTTSVKSNGSFLKGGTKYGPATIIRGLNLEVEGRGGSGGELVAEKIRFNEADLRVARSVESRAAPLEERASSTETKLGQVEENAQRLSGQLDELAAVANTAKGGAKAAQASADAAITGVNETNERISSLDDYVPQTSAAVNFKVNSADLSDEAKVKLDELATRAMNTKGYVIEVSGYTDATGSVEKNRILSQRRADAVIQYLVENHQIPLRRIVTPYGYGKSNPIADNTTKEGRAQNRRVEVKLLVNKGLTQPAPTVRPTTSGSEE